RRRLLLLTAFCLLPSAYCSRAAAQSPRDKVQIRSVRVGFPPGPGATDGEDTTLGVRQTLYKPGAWAPVYVDVINAGNYDRKRDGRAEGTAETPDADATAPIYIVDLPPFDGLGNPSSVIAYPRPGGRYGEFTVRVVANGRDLCQPAKLGSGSPSGMGANGL